LTEPLPQFKDAHERAFEYFAGHTREHLYDRPRTACHGTSGGHILWNPTFKAFADYWSFEPRLCQPYRAQTKGYVAYCTSLVGCGADLRRRAQAASPFHL
jgi:transposase